MLDELLPEQRARKNMGNSRQEIFKATVMLKDLLKDINDDRGESDE